MKTYNEISRPSASIENGFSLVELMVGMLAAAIIALTAGAMLYYGFRSLGETSTAVELQRDGTLAMRSILTALREASGTNVTVAGGSQISISLADRVAFFEQRDNDLFFDYDTGSAGNEALLVEGTLDRLTATYRTNKIDIEIVLGDGENTAEMNGSVTFRN